MDSFCHHRRVFKSNSIEDPGDVQQLYLWIWPQNDMTLDTKQQILERGRVSPRMDVKLLLE